MLFRSNRAEKISAGVQPTSALRNASVKDNFTSYVLPTALFRSTAVEGFDAASNIFLGAEPLAFGLFVNRRRMHREAADLLGSLGIVLPSTRARASSLSGGQRQSLAVARALVRSTNTGGLGLIAFDEPTAALGVRESGHILAQ